MNHKYNFDSEQMMKVHKIISYLKWIDEDTLCHVHNVYCIYTDRHDEHGLNLEDNRIWKVSDFTDVFSCFTSETIIKMFVDWESRINKDHRYFHHVYSIHPCCVRSFDNLLSFVPILHIAAYCVEQNQDLDCAHIRDILDDKEENL